MPSSFARLVATAGVWLMSGLIVISATTGSVRDLNAVILVAIVMFVAAYTTRVIWQSIADVGVTVAAEKSKRIGSRRVNRIVESLSDDELEELRSRLSSDGEMMPLETLLNQQRQDTPRH